MRYKSIWMTHEWHTNDMSNSSRLYSIWSFYIVIFNIICGKYIALHGCEWFWFLGCSNFCSFLRNIFQLVIHMYSYIMRMSLVCYPYLTRMYSYVILMPLLYVGKSSLCTCMPFVCYPYALACHPHVTRMYLYVIRMYSYVTRMSLVCHSCVTHMYSFVCHLYVIRMTLVCIRMSSVCPERLLNILCMFNLRRVHTGMWFYHEPN